jgi:uncharacterized membrane protein HdeD (DUF308 family)
MDTSPGERAAKSGQSARHQRLLRGILIVRAIIVLALGVSFLFSGDDRPILGNLLATFWLIGAVLTLAWVRTNWRRSGWRLALTAGILGVVAAVIGLSRLFIAGAISANSALALLGCSAVLVGTLRLLGAFRDEASERPRPSRRFILGGGEVIIGIVWITTDEMTRAVTNAVGLWALLGGAIMLIDAMSARRTRGEPAPA